jgi:hypothetical protein
MKVNLKNIEDKVEGNNQEIIKFEESSGQQFIATRHNKRLNSTITRKEIEEKFAENHEMQKKCLIKSEKLEVDVTEIIKFN